MIYVVLGTIISTLAVSALTAGACYFGYKKYIIWRAYRSGPFIRSVNNDTYVSITPPDGMDEINLDNESDNE